MSETTRLLCSARASDRAALGALYARHEGRLFSFIRSRMPPALGELEQRFLLEVGTDALPEVRLVFRPSRGLALEQPDFDRYWAGTLDVTVPIER